MSSPTVPDLVVLAVLAEGPLHGYALNAELRRRAVEDWAPVSRPQVYYSLKKLEAEGWIESEAAGPSLGPDRRAFRVTPDGRRALESGLARPEWADGRGPYRFDTWVGLSPFASPGAREAVLAAREARLRDGLDQEAAHLAAAQAHESVVGPVGASMVRHKIRLAQAELVWISEIRGLILAFETDAD